MVLFFWFLPHVDAICESITEQTHGNKESICKIYIYIHILNKGFGRKFALSRIRTHVPPFLIGCDNHYTTRTTAAIDDVIYMIRALASRETFFQGDKAGEPITPLDMCGYINIYVHKFYVCVYKYICIYIHTHVHVYSREA